MLSLTANGTLVRHIIASLFRVTWGFALAAVIAVPCGLLLAWYRRPRMVIMPLVRLLRPISPLAWIPLSTIWFGIGDVSAVLLIFVTCAPTLLLLAMSAAGSVREIEIRAARNFGLSGLQLLRRVVLPAASPQLLSGIRVTLGMAWIVLVAAEMISVNSGLGFLILDARNAGDRLDVVMAAMLTIGLIGLAVDRLMQRIERTGLVRWAPAGAR
jgi:NitT/TauT family transport system permease protein